ncbi:MAG: hypothetical protein NVS9B15_25420 [Acidobacteriaceae bacterium]
MLADLSLLIARLTLGGLMAGHGAQKLFGWFEGPGLKGTHGLMDTLGMKPGKVWGSMAAAGEFSGGVLTALGFLTPVGPQNIASAMIVATRRAHWNKPIWVGKGGAELPLTNLGIALVIAAVGPGRFSLDRMFGIRLPKWFVALTWLNTVAITAAALFRPQIAQQMVDTVQNTAGTVNSSQESPSHDENTDSEIVTETRPRAEVEESQHAGI